MKFSLSTITICLLIFFISCNEETTKRISLTTSLINYPKESKLVLYKLTPYPTPFDTASLTTNGEFFFTKSIKTPAYYQLLFENNQALTLILHPKEETIVKADAEHILSSTVIHNNKESNQILKAERISKGLTSELETLTSQLTLSKLKKSKRDSIIQTIDTLKDLRKQILTRLLKEGLDDLSSLPILYQKSGNHTFFDINTDDSLFLIADTFLIKHYGNMQLVKNFHYSLDSALIKKDSLDNIFIGDKLADPMYPTYWNESLPLSKFKGKPVVLFFWKSDDINNRWLEPEIKRIINLKNKFAIEVCMISLDTIEKNWKTSIDYHRLACWHFSDLNGFNSEKTKQMSVRLTPSNILIDKNGYIVSKNTWGEQLFQSIKHQIDQ